MRCRKRGEFSLSITLRSRKEERGGRKNERRETDRPLVSSFATRLSSLRSHHLHSLLTYLSPLIEPPTPLLPHPSLLLSHAPFIRHLVAQDEAFILEEAQGLRAAEEGGRTIRPSAKAAMIALAIGRTGGEMAGGGSSRLYGYQRWVVGLEEGELKEVRGSGLVRGED